MLTGVYDESASYVGDTLYRHAQHFRIIHYSRRHYNDNDRNNDRVEIGRDARETRGPSRFHSRHEGWDHTHTSARRAGRQLGKLLTNNTAGDNDTGCHRLRPHRQIAPFCAQSPVRFRSILARGAERCDRMENGTVTFTEAWRSKKNARYVKAPIKTETLTD